MTSNSNVSPTFAANQTIRVNIGGKNYAMIKTPTSTTNQPTVTASSTIVNTPSTSSVRFELDQQQQQQTPSTIKLPFQTVQMVQLAGNSATSTAALPSTSASSGHGRTGANISRGEELYNVQKEMEDFWPNQKAMIERTTLDKLREATRTQELPLARIKKIMKLDDAVKQQMISAEVPMLFAKACEIFIEELTLRTWQYTEENKRKTLQKSDLAMAVSKYDQFDFLIDIVPRDEIIKQPQAQAPGSIQNLPPRQTSRTSTSSDTFQALVDNNAPQIQTVVPGQQNSAEPLQYFIQLPVGSNGEEQTMLSGSGGQPLQLCVAGGGQIMQATQIGQPIPLQQSSNMTLLSGAGVGGGAGATTSSDAGGGVQLMTVNADGTQQPIQLQFVTSADGQQTQQLQIVHADQIHTEQQQQQ